MRTFLCALSLLVAGSAAAQTAIYRWVDADGVTHFADTLSNVPAGARVETTTGEDVWTVAPSERQPTAAAAPGPLVALAAPKPVAINVEPKVSDEERWRGQFAAARERIATLQDEIAVDRETIGALGPVLQCGYAPMVPSRRHAGVLIAQGGCIAVPNPEYTRRQDRLALNEKALVRAKEQLADLERRAAHEAVPLEWRR